MSRRISLAFLDVVTNKVLYLLCKKESIMVELIDFSTHLYEYIDLS